MTLAAGLFLQNAQAKALQAADFTAGQSPWGGLFQFFGAICVLLVVLFAAYKVTRLIGQKYQAQSMRGSYIEVVERMAIGQDRALYIVRLRDKVLLLGVTAHHVELLAELDPQQYEDLPPRDQNPDVFSSVLGETIKNWGNKLQGKKDQDHE